jgi:hypothetical protein
MKGRPLRGIVCGFLFGLFLALLLLTLGVVPLDNIAIAVFPIAFLLVGLILAAVAPFKRSRLQETTPAPATAAPGPSPTPPPDTPGS